MAALLNIFFNPMLKRNGSATAFPLVCAAHCKRFIAEAAFQHEQFDDTYREKMRSLRKRFKFYDIFV